MMASQPHDPASSRPGDSPACREAIRLVSLGLWPVPIYSPFADHANAGKAPIGKGWGLHKPTPESLRETYAAYPDAGIGIRLGREGGVIDVENDGCDDFEDAFVEMMGGECVETMGWSSRRGTHHLFRYDERLARYEKSKFIDFKYKGIEVRIGSLPGDKKQVQSVCPPSLMTERDATDKIIALGQRRWNGVDAIATLPDSFFALADRLLAEKSAGSRPAPPPGKAAIDRDPAIRRYALSALDAETSRLSAASPGDRNNQLNKSAFALGQIVAAGALARGVVEAILHDAALSAGLAEGEIGPTIRSGLDDGAEYPRNLDDVGRADKPRDGVKGVPGVKGVRAYKPDEEDDECPIPSRAWPAPPSEAAWHGPAGEFARIVAPYTEADPVGILAQFLVGFGSLIGRSAFFQINATRHYMNLFCCTAGVTALARKGTAWDIVKAGLSNVDPDYVLNRITSGLSSGEGLIWEVRDKVEVEEDIKDPGQPTRRGMVTKDAGVSDKRLLVIETELGGTLKVLTREGNTLSSLIRQAWDSGTLRTLTKNNINKATDAHISIVGHVTEFEVNKYLNQNEASNGFANRFLWLLVGRSQLLPDGAPIPMELMRPILDRVKEAAGFAIDPIRMDRDPGVREFWHRAYANLSRPKPGLIGSITSRSIPIVMRLACLYALLDRTRVVGHVHLEAALALWEYSDRSVAYIFGESLGDKDADKLLAALQASPEGLTRAQIRSDVFQRNKSSDAIAAILGRLEEAGLVRYEKVPTGHRPATLWKAR